MSPFMSCHSEPVVDSPLLTQSTARQGSPDASLASTANGLLGRLCDAIEQRFGLYPNELMEAKLRRLLGLKASSSELDNSQLSIQALTRQVSELESLPARHPRWLDLVVRLTVHETYFFRDEPQLTMLRQTILPQIIARAAQLEKPRIRLWSACCSTGEEVYSLAILMLDALRSAGYAYGNEDASISLMPGWQVEVLGTDISTAALQVARDARYAEENLGSFRRLDARWLRWFEPVEATGQRLDDIVSYRQPKRFVRDITHFEQHNVLDSGASLQPFDLIVCRNALIYFQDANKRVVQQHFLDALGPDGVLLLGAADPMLCPQHVTQLRAERLPYYVKKESVKKAGMKNESAPITADGLIDGNNGLGREVQHGC